MIGGAIGRWSIPIGEVFGTRVRLHWTFALLLVWMAFTAGEGTQGAVVGLAFTVGLIASLLLHEAGHGVGARLFGSRTHEVVLYPIGGVARLERSLTATGELVVACAGPVVQLGVVGSLALVAALASGGLPETQEGLLGQDGLLMLLLAANMLVLLVNIAPVWPLDGGRFVRAALAITIGADRAPLAGARVGQGFGLLVAAGGILAPPLILLGGVLFLGATQDAGALRRARSVRHLRAGDAMIRRFEVVPPHENLGRAGERLLGSRQRAFPVIDGWGRLVGLLTRNALLAGLDRIGPDGSVSDVMKAEVRTIDIATPLDRVSGALELDPSGALVVLQDGKVAGLITAERLAEITALGIHVESRSEL